MSREHVNHKDIVRYAEEKVNLPADKALEYRAQAKRLRDKLETYIGEHPDFSLKRMQLSGSLAKGTALRSLNDIDVAVYISGADTPKDIKALLDYLAERLRKAFSNFTPEQVQPQTYSVTVNFKGTGLNVDVVPVLYSGLPDWRGNLVSQEDGSFLETSIPLHLTFARKRKEAKPKDFAQVVRLVKHWAKRQKQENDDFRLKSFITEMILAKLCDEGVDFSDYPEALQAFFTYLARSGLREQIVFTDNYKVSEVGKFTDPVRIIDPVNPANNVARLYTDANVRAIVDAALEAGDAIDSALAATTKEKTVYYWQKVFGPTFQG
jgi:tRNA nucleotidyltransferase (CCA-adding enzyme)